MAQRAWLSKKLGSGKILCQTCTQSCKLEEGLKISIVSPEFIFYKQAVL